jgi:hypothetical protein
MRTPMTTSRLPRLLVSLAVGFMLVTSGAARAAEPIKYAESPEGLEKLTQDMLAAVKDGNKERAAELAKSMILPNYEAWFVKTFGEEKGKSLAEQYAGQAATFDKDAVKLFEDQLRQNRTNIKAYKLESADDNNGTGAQRAAIAAMKEKAPLYGVRLVEPGKTAGMHLWSFVYVDGTFRHAGKMSGR